MIYHRNLSQFIEDGAAVRAERARIARLTARKYELLRPRLERAAIEPTALAA